MVWEAPGRVLGPPGTHFGAFWAPKSTQNPSKMVPGAPLDTQMRTTWHPDASGAANQAHFGGSKLPKYSPKSPKWLPKWSKIGQK